jgi:hypothetical protein
LKFLKIALPLIVLLNAAFAFAMPAQPLPIPEEPMVAPQINISGSGVGTLDLGKTADHTRTKGRVNFSDSAIQVGAAQKLFGDGAVGSFGFGALTTEESNRATSASLFLHQTFADYQSERFEALIGRSDNPTAHLVDFPTLRGDDLVTLTNPVNPFSNGENTEEHRYANIASFSLNQDLRYFENFHVQHLIDSASHGTDTNINSFGLSLNRLGTPGMEAFETLPAWGVGFEQIVDVPTAKNGLHQIYGGGSLNLKQSAVNRIELNFQNIYSWGSNLRSFQNITDSFRADSNSAAVSLRYLRSPFGGAASQLALTLAHKTYLRVKNADSWGVALTGVKHLGPGFDVVAQYLAQARKSALANVQSPGAAYEQTFELGLAFNFDATFNEHISPRRSILNQSHGFVRD